MPFSSSSSMKKKPHYRIWCVGKVLCVFLVVFGLEDVDAQSSEAQAMADLKANLVLPKGRWEEADYCDWDGISCKGDQVVTIQLKENLSPPITGTLSGSLNNLTGLTHLELRQTRIGGALPTLSGLSSLRELLLSENNFTSIPGDFFQGLTSLESVTMDRIPLAPGPIPASLSTCSNLKNFSMNSANINGMIPGFFNSENFPTLIELHLASNYLEGELPANFSQLTMLQSLWLNGQNLNGTIAVLANMTALSQVWLNKNSFTGALPDFTGLTQLVDFNIRDNQITGIVPESLTNLASLQVVNLTNNLLHGPVPVFGNSVQVDMNAGTNLFCLDGPGSCSENVTIMLSIAKNWGYPENIVKDWEGNDACIWPGISCFGKDIKTINFVNKGLKGTISPDFSKLALLETLNLAQNHLDGKIPKELTTLEHLKTLDLSNNNLSGLEPTFDKRVNTKFGGNPSLGKEEGSPSSPGASGPSPPGGSDGGGGGGGGSGRKGVPVGAIVGTVIAVVSVLLIGLIGFCVYKKKHKSGRTPNAMVVHPHHSGSDQDMVKITVAGSNVNVGTTSESLSHASSGSNDIQMVEAGNMVISIQVLRNVTNNFSDDNVLGRGGFGTVYKGELHDGTKIAVKRMESGVMGSKGLAEFKSEIAVLNKVRHRHLVSLIGYCVDGNERILVYEFMPQGTLSEHLFHWREEDLKPLTWTRRLSIALDVARGVEYLHGLASQSFIHRDLKPSNILLGDDMRAKVADFGLVRLAPEGKASIETRLAGTFGYLAPEYAATGRVTTKVDVYAFGVILMELITGRKALDESQPDESMHLVTWFRRMFNNKDKDTFRKALDPVIDADEEALACISTVSDLAGYCCSREPHQRPDMGHIVNVLSSFVELWKPSDKDPEDIYGIDMDQTLSQAVQMWQATDGNTTSFCHSMDDTQGSIPSRPEGLAQSFLSGDGR